MAFFPSNWLVIWVSLCKSIESVFVSRNRSEGNASDVSIHRREPEEDIPDIRIVHGFHDGNNYRGRVDSKKSTINRWAVDSFSGPVNPENQDHRDARSDIEVQRGGLLRSHFPGGLIAPTPVVKSSKLTGASWDAITIEVRTKDASLVACAAFTNPQPPKGPDIMDVWNRGNQGRCKEELKKDEDSTLHIDDHSTGLNTGHVNGGRSVPTVDHSADILLGRKALPDVGRSANYAGTARGPLSGLDGTTFISASVETTASSSLRFPLSFSTAPVSGLCTVEIDRLRKMRDYHVWCIASVSSFEAKTGYVLQQLSNLYPQNDEGILDYRGKLPHTTDVSANEMHEKIGMEMVLLVCLIMCYTLFALWKQRDPLKDTLIKARTDEKEQAKQKRYGGRHGCKGGCHDNIDDSRLEEHLDFTGNMIAAEQSQSDADRSETTSGGNSKGSSGNVSRNDEHHVQIAMQRNDYQSDDYGNHKHSPERNPVFWNPTSVATSRRGGDATSHRNHEMKKPSCLACCCPSSLALKSFKFQLHHTTLTLIVGVCFSVLLFYIARAPVMFDYSIFCYIFLPIIIFNEGYTLRHRGFFKNIGWIMTLGICGTMMTFFLFLTFGATAFLYNPANPATDWWPVLSPMDIVILAACLCSSDTVAPLTFLKAETHPKTFSIVFGEGVVNDVVSVLLVCAASSIPGSQLQWGNLGVSLLWFFAASSIFGLIHGVLLCYASRKLMLWKEKAKKEATRKKRRTKNIGSGHESTENNNSQLKKTILRHNHKLAWSGDSDDDNRYNNDHDSIHETVPLVILLFSGNYVCYLLAELWDLSSILALFVCSVLCGHYAKYNINGTNYDVFNEFLEKQYEEMGSGFGSTDEKKLAKVIDAVPDMVLESDDDEALLLSGFFIGKEDGQIGKSGGNDYVGGGNSMDYCIQQYARDHRAGDGDGNANVQKSVSSKKSVEIAVTQYPDKGFPPTDTSRLSIGQPFITSLILGEGTLGTTNGTVGTNGNASSRTTKTGSPIDTNSSLETRSSSSEEAGGSGSLNQTWSGKLQGNPSFGNLNSIGSGYLSVASDRVECEFNSVDFKPDNVDFKSDLSRVFSKSTASISKGTTINSKAATAPGAFKNMEPVETKPVAKHTTPTTTSGTSILRNITGKASSSSSKASEVDSSSSSSSASATPVDDPSQQLEATQSAEQPADRRKPWWKFRFSVRDRVCGDPVTGRPTDLQFENRGSITRKCEQFTDVGAIAGAKIQQLRSNSHYHRNTQLQNSRVLHRNSRMKSDPNIAPKNVRIQDSILMNQDDHFNMSKPMTGRDEDLDTNWRDTNKYDHDRLITKNDDVLVLEPLLGMQTLLDATEEPEPKNLKKKSEPDLAEMVFSVLAEASEGAMFAYFGLSSFSYIHNVNITLVAAYGVALGIIRLTVVCVLFSVHRIVQSCIRKFRTRTQERVIQRRSGFRRRPREHRIRRSNVHLTAGAIHSTHISSVSLPVATTDNEAEQADSYAGANGTHFSEPYLVGSLRHDSTPNINVQPGMTAVVVSDGAPLFQRSDGKVKSTSENIILPYQIGGCSVPPKRQRASGNRASNIRAVSFTQTSTSMCGPGCMIGPSHPTVPGLVGQQSSASAMSGLTPRVTPKEYSDAPKGTWDGNHDVIARVCSTPSIVQHDTASENRRSGLHSASENIHSTLQSAAENSGLEVVETKDDHLTSNITKRDLLDFSVIAVAGMMRGTIAFALVIRATPTDVATNSQELQSTILLIVMINSLLVGLLFPLLLSVSDAQATAAGKNTSTNSNASSFSYNMVTNATLSDENGRGSMPATHLRNAPTVRNRLYEPLLGQTGNKSGHAAGNRSSLRKNANSSLRRNGASNRFRGASSRLSNISDSQLQDRKSLHRKWIIFDENYLKPMLGGKPRPSLLRRPSDLDCP